LLDSGVHQPDIIGVQDGGQDSKMIRFVVFQSEFSLMAQITQACSTEMLKKYYAYVAFPHHTFVADRQGEGPGAIIGTQEREP
jgi:hypothetical protein